MGQIHVFVESIARVNGEITVKHKQTKNATFTFQYDALL